MASTTDQIKPTLPFDIIESILDQLAYDDDTQTLHACSLLNEDTLHLCRSHLFRTFDMRARGASGEESSLITFYGLLSVSPHLVPYVRVVHILDLNSKHWVLNHPILPRFLQLLTDLEIFGLHVMKPVTWKVLDPALLSWMTELAARPTLVGLHLTGVEDVSLAFLNSCRFLKSLNLDTSSLEPRTSLNDEEEQAEKRKSTGLSDGDRISLESITFANCQLFLARLNDYMGTTQPFLDFSRLRDININFTPSAFDVTWKIIRSARKTLETLKVSQSYTDGSSTQTQSFMLSTGLDAHRQLLPHVTLAPMHQLRQLSFTILVQDLYSPSPSESIGEWCLLFRTAPPGIEKIHITLDLFFLYPGGVAGLFPPSPSRKSSKSKSGPKYEEELQPTLFSELDETLSSGQFFPCLSQIIVEIQLPEDHSDSSDSEYAVYGDDDSDGPHQPSLTFEEIKASVNRMMKQARRKLGRTTPAGAVGDAFKVLVGVGN
ncbi:hypothetical protein GALMADRAFT_232647 [Galerina marginata CBS 339.88]|uniref:Uncharacterized protein n=1 Tax=Galerina marginata (strain CBS 339.88) TaxID=685588 RepID=A0A067S665_GALM3|nr:hypothetical protein GALMADRAFT_232647 [Galerina marginata CBS 339.88]